MSTMPTEFKVQSGNLTAADVWREKDEWAQREAASLQEWSTMDDETRETIIEIVDRYLDRMKDAIEHWVPASLSIKPGKYLDVQFRILFSDVESELKAQREMTERRLRQAKMETKAMLESMGVQADD